jgi:hypothetical protein
MSPTISTVVTILMGFDLLEFHSQTEEVLQDGETFPSYFGRHWSTEDEYVAAYLILMANALGPKNENDGLQKLRDYVQTEAVRVKAASIWPQLTTAPCVDCGRVIAALH